MAKEAFIEVNCSRCYGKVFEVIKLLNELGWKYYGNEQKVEYLPLGDDDNFGWQKEYLEAETIEMIINSKQDNDEQIGLILYYNNAEGITMLARNTDKLVFNININRKTINNKKNGLTDIGWYFKNIIFALQEKGCIIDRISFEEYEG